MTSRSFQLIQIGEKATRFEVMIYREDLCDKQPLFILPSIEYPAPPSASFCDHMWQNGYQVIFVRRAGFGQSSPLPKSLIRDELIKNGATTIAEAVMLRALITRMALSNVVVLAVGSSNPVVYRLVQVAPEIKFTVFMNPVFNQEIWELFYPAWFGKMLKQIITSKSGLHIAAQGMKMLIKRDPISFFSRILQHNSDDLDYVDRNQADYHAASRDMLSFPPGLLYYDVVMCLSHDPLLKDSYFDGIDAAILIGQNTGKVWKTKMEREAKRLSLPIVQSPRGHLFCGYASPETLLDTIERKGRKLALPQ